MDSLILLPPAGGIVRLWRIGFRHFLPENDEHNNPEDPVNPVQ